MKRPTEPSRFHRALRLTLIGNLMAIALRAVALGGWLALPPRASGAQGIDFSALAFSAEGLPARQTFEARDGTPLGYRYYPADSETILVLLHGSGSDSRYFHPLAAHLAGEDAAVVIVPDLRGHGPIPLRRGNVDYLHSSPLTIALPHPKVTHWKTKRY